VCLCACVTMHQSVLLWLDKAIGWIRTHRMLGQGIIIVGFSLCHIATAWERQMEY
jgi:hypothetical protein